MVDISRKTYERNSVEIVVDSYGIFWLNEKYEGLDHNLLMTIVKYLSDNRKQRCAVVDEPKNLTKQSFYSQRISNQSHHVL